MSDLRYLFSGIFDESGTEDGLNLEFVFPVDSLPFAFLAEIRVAIGSFSLFFAGTMLLTDLRRDPLVIRSTRDLRMTSGRLYLVALDKITNNT